jgi:hypothetical protein
MSRALAVGPALLLLLGAGLLGALGACSGPSDTSGGAPGPGSGAAPSEDAGLGADGADPRDSGADASGPDTADAAVPPKLPTVKATGVERISTTIGLRAVSCSSSSCFVAGKYTVLELVNGASTFTSLTSAADVWSDPICATPGGTVYASRLGANLGERKPPGTGFAQRQDFQADYIQSLACGDGTVRAALAKPLSGANVVGLPITGPNAPAIGVGLPIATTTGTLAADAAGNLAVTVNGTLYRLVAGQTAWTAVAGAPPHIDRFTFDPAGNLYGVSDINGLVANPGYWKWERSSATWSHLLDGVVVGTASLEYFEGSPVVADGAGALFAAVAVGAGTQLIKTMPGQVWSSVATGLPAGKCGAMALAADGRLIIVCESGVYRTTP